MCGALSNFSLRDSKGQHWHYSENPTNLGFFINRIPLEKNYEIKICEEKTGEAQEQIMILKDQQNQRSFSPFPTIFLLFGCSYHFLLLLFFFLFLALSNYANSHLISNYTPFLFNFFLIKTWEIF